MAGVLNISEAASLAMHSLALIASRKEMTSVKQISAELGVSEFHLSKVLQRLSRHGLVRSTRGPRGGFTLARDSREITLLDIYEAIEGRLDDTACIMDKKSCHNGKCILGKTITEMASLFREHLGGTRISDIMDIYQTGEAS